MTIKMHEWQVVGGSLFAVILAARRLTAPRYVAAGMSEVLEGASFLCCAIGVSTGARAIRERLEAMGDHKAVALKDAAYMQDRCRLQVTAAVATSAIWSLIAGREGFNPLTSLAVLVIFLAMLPLINRLTGWTSA